MEKFDREQNILSDNSFHLLQIGVDEGLFMYTGIQKFGYTFEFPSPKGWVGGNMKQEIGCIYLCGAPYKKVLEEMLGRRNDHWTPTPLIEEITQKYWEKG